MTRILFITNFAPHYRVGAFEELSKYNRIKFYFFSDFEEDFWEKKNPIIKGKYESKTFKGFYILPKFKISLSLLFTLFNEEYDIIIKCINGRLIFPLVFLITKMRRKKFILWQTIWFHPNTIFHRISYPILKYIWHNSDAIVVYGIHGKNFLISKGIDSKKIFVACQAVDNSFFNNTISDEDKYKLKSKLAINNKKVILYVGRLTTVKGIKYLIEAFNELNRDDMVLLLIGKGELEKELKIQALNRKNIHFLDYISQDELPLYYSITSIFVLPSISWQNTKEPWGLVVNEAMNQGCPIIATDSVGAAVGGLVKNNINGIIVPEKSAKDIRNAIEQILNDKNLYEKMRKNSKEKVAEFNFKNWASGFNQAINYSYQRN